MNAVYGARTIKRDRRTREQLAQLDRQILAELAGDRRALHVAYTVEAEAMPANTLRELLRERIEWLLPERALEVAKVAEASERHGLRLLADMLTRRARA